MFAKFQCLRTARWLFVTTVLAAFLGTTTGKSVVAQANQSPILYFFTNDGCAPCLSVKPAIDRLTANGYPIKTLKASEHAQFAQQLGVDRTPTVVLIAGNRIVGRHAGLIDGATLQQWFTKVGVSAQPAFNRISTTPRNTTPDYAANPAKVGTKVVIPRQVTHQDPNRRHELAFSSPTMLRGTAQPRSVAERRAMEATVRLKVDDDEGTSYATGTVIHTHGNESLVMTCGHVFRDSKGQGRITAEYDFYNQPRTASGRLVDYEAQAKDIALVVIRTDAPLPAVPLAEKRSPIQTGVNVFSIGCDHGEDPTIRHSQIKNRAAYDGSLKYDIFGRPVDGRSGGGLFTESGHLIGVCNAAAVEVDEGIYSALDTLYWQLATTGLEHLFDSDTNQRLAATPTPEIPGRSTSILRGPPAGDRFAEVGRGNQQFADQLNQERMRQARTTPPSRGQGFSGTPERSGVRQPMAPIASLGRADWGQVNNVGGTRPYNQNTKDNSSEVVIIVRSKQDPRVAERIVIDDPTPELLEYLGNMQSK